jgi:GrpB-like predicted nucleotidyltransferase (UPF0157 family)
LVFARGANRHAVAAAGAFTSSFAFRAFLRATPNSASSLKTLCRSSGGVSAFLRDWLGSDAS